MKPSKLFYLGWLGLVGFLGHVLDPALLWFKLFFFCFWIDGFVGAVRRWRARRSA